MTAPEYTAHRAFSRDAIPDVSAAAIVDRIHRRISVRRPGRMHQLLRATRAQYGRDDRSRSRPTIGHRDHTSSIRDQASREALSINLWL
ncbi:hypothetical protein HGA13_28580 [Nocardia speluncae]|uniref:Uncharacterized protein n=1 Tax=Nocardia speluncae TaxID=419477 RepID=A0A846XNW3_9NOCA|nr:hypothetical protein [Nocardia speluncae]NKY36995.1 hypothetical protein [Nocardia speluncae]